MNEARHREAEGAYWASLDVAPTERNVDLRSSGATIRVQELGSGPPIVFVHGGSVSGTCWAPLVARLPHFRCIVVDRPGCGLSAPMTSRLADREKLARFADAFVADVMDALGIDRADVVGTSFGGFISLRSVAAHPERFGRMMEFGWPIGAPIEKTPLVMRLTGVPLLARAMSSIPPNKAGARMILRQIGLKQALKAGRISPEGEEWFLSLLRDTKTVRNELDALPPLIHPFRGLNAEMLLPAELLRGIAAPVSFQWGAEDLYGGQKVARPFTAQLPNAELVLWEGAGHAVWMDDPERAAAAVTGFFEH